MRALILAGVALLLAPAQGFARSCSEFEWVQLAAEPVTEDGGDVDLAVPPDAGRFYAVMFEVKDSHLAMTNVRVVFKGGRYQSPKRELVFEAAKPRAYVDFSQNAKEIDHIEFTYRILSGGAAGEIALFGERRVRNGC